jgi:thiol:disulfide interchange protein DsbG
MQCASDNHHATPARTFFVKRRHFALTIATAPWVLGACTDKPASSAPAAAPAAAKPGAHESYDIAARGNGFTIGAVMAANTVYVFFDPACPHCAHLWMASKPLLTRLKMVWMPISLLRRSSAPQGATILSAADPSAAMTENETSVLDNRGGISASPTLSDEMLAKVQTNTELFAKLGADSVPLIVYRNARTGEYGSVTGAVTTEQLAEMAGV